MQPNATTKTTGQAFVLPIEVATKRDVVRLQLLLEQYLDELVRASTISPKQLPTIPAEIVQLCAENAIQELNAHEIERLKGVFAELLSKSPLIHIALSSEPDEKNLNRLTAWFRQEIHPLCLLQVSVQPSIAGGCIVRTSNRIYDCSFRHMLLVNQKKLAEALLQ